ncbi:MAG: hypothetical protein ACOXZK_01740 [Bacteroidales bacterium]
MKFQAQIILVDYRAINDYNRDMGSGSYSNRDYLEVQIHNGLFMNEINIAHISQKGQVDIAMVGLSKRMNNIIKAVASSGNTIELEIF